MSDRACPNDAFHEVRYQITPQQVSTSVQGTAVILSLITNQYYSLEATGSLIWSALEQPVTLAALANLICGAYDVDPDLARADLATLLAHLESEQLVMRC